MAEQATLEGFEAAALRVGVTGALRTAAIGTKVMTDFKEKYDTSIYLNRGYISPDGVEISFDEDTNEFIPWQEALPIRRDITKSVKAIKVTLWQFTRDNASLYFGVPGGQIKVNDDGSWYFDEGNLPEFEHQQCVLDVVDGDKAMRITLLDAQVTGRSGMTFKREDAIGLEITLTGFPAGKEYADQQLSGKTARWLFSAGWDGSGAKGATSSSDDGAVPLKVQTQQLPAGTNGQEYSVTLAALGGEAPYNWSVDGTPALPAGLSLNRDGKITGTPTAASTTEITFKVEDGKKRTATQKLQLVVNDA